MPFARGVVEKLIRLGGTHIAEIEWNNPEIPRRVSVANLSRVTEKGIAD